MKRITLTICTTAMLLFSCNNEKTANQMSSENTIPADSAATGEEQAWIPVDTAAQMKAWTEASTPGEPHKMLARSNGTWNGEVTMWMSPDAPPATSTATMTNKMVMDGRYQLSEFKGSFMGQPFTGMSTTAYDNVTKQFMSTWIDNMGTGIMKMEGPWDEASKTITLTGKMMEPTTGRECNMREVFKIIDDNTQMMEMYGPDPQTGKEFKSMAIKLTRRK